MKKAIIFDLDGTLWDSTGRIYEIWNRVFEKHKDILIRLNQKAVEQYMGKTMDEIGSLLFPDKSVEFQKRIMNECEAEECTFLRKFGATLYDGIEDTLAELKKKYKLYIVSNCQDGYVQAFLHAHNLEEYFDDIEMSGRTGKKKGDNIRLIISRNQIEEAVYVGDTEGDEQAARYANIPFIYAKYGFGNATNQDASIEAFSDLIKVITNF